MEKFTPTPEKHVNSEALKAEVGALQENVDALKNVVSIVTSSGLEALKTIFGK